MIGEKELLANQDVQLAKSEAIERYSIQLGAELARRKLTNAPLKALSGGEAEEWADKKLLELLPLAIAEQEFQLRFGDDEQRAKASTKIMEATGRGKRDVGGNGTSPIIMINAGAATLFPWLKQPEKDVTPNQPLPLTEQ